MAAQKKYIVKRSFAARVNGESYRFAEGQELTTIPRGADWIKAGFVEEVKPQAPAQKRSKAQSAKAETREKR